MSRLLMAVVGFCLGLAGLAGCSDGTGGRCGVSGKIQFKGAPLDTGMIMFNPEDTKLGTQASALITKGEYKIAAAQGLLPGKYRVAISSGDGKTPDGDPNAAPGPTGNFSSKERIPAKYNLETTLTADVKAGDKNAFDFTIP